MTFFSYSRKLTPPFDGSISNPERMILLACRWRTTGKSGMHSRGKMAQDCGFTPDQFYNLKSAGLLHQSKAGYHRLLPLGYKVLESTGTLFPRDTSFPKNWESKARLYEVQIEETE